MFDGEFFLRSDPPNLRQDELLETAVGVGSFYKTDNQTPTSDLIMLRR